MVETLDREVARVGSDEFNAMRAFIERMLIDAALGINYLDWTVQGFGMIRTCFGPHKKYRLNVWDSALTVPNVSTVHDHPWSFKSWVINGPLTNVRFVEDYYNGAEFDFMVIKTGEGGGPRGVKKRIRLRNLEPERYGTGEIYNQSFHEIHRSLPADGCVTLNERTRVGDSEHARVFWHAGEEWVDAMPRPATQIEVATTINNALTRWERW